MTTTTKKVFINGVALMSNFGYEERSAKSTIAFARNKGKLECETPDSYNTEETSVTKWLNESSKNSRGKVYQSGKRIDEAINNTKNIELYVPTPKISASSAPTKKTLTLLLQQLAEMSIANYEKIAADRPDIIEKMDKKEPETIAEFIEQA